MRHPKDGEKDNDYLEIMTDNITFGGNSLDKGHYDSRHVPSLS